MRPALPAALLLALAAFTAAQDARPEDTPAAARTRKLLKTKVSVDFKDTRLEDVMDEIKEMVKGLKIMLDSKGGVSRNRTVTYAARDKTVEAVFDEMFKKMGLGYIVISRKGNAYDGIVQVRQSDERGYEKKK
jgi:hypothetical protein